MSGDPELPLYEILMRLNGPIRPTGEHGTDEHRLENLKRLTALVDSLLGEIDDISRVADSHEASVKAIGQHAYKFMESVTDE